MAWDAANLTAQVVASAVVLPCSAWLQTTGLSLEMQTSIQDLPFNRVGLFSEQTDAMLHGLKDTRATLRSLGMHTP